MGLPTASLLVVQCFEMLWSLLLLFRPVKMQCVVSSDPERPLVVHDGLWTCLVGPQLDQGTFSIDGVCNRSASRPPKGSDDTHRDTARSICACFTSSGSYAKSFPRNLDQPMKLDVFPSNPISIYLSLIHLCNSSSVSGVTGG